MNKNDRSTTVLGLTALLAVLATTAPAPAMNDPVTGRWTTRDPLNYDAQVSASTVMGTGSDPTITLRAQNLRRMRPISRSTPSAQLFEFGMANPSRKQDPSGLCPVQPSCSLIDTWPPEAKQEYACGFKELSNGHDGGVVCLCGEKWECFWSKGLDPQYETILKPCVEAHETVHSHGKTNCDPCCDCPQTPCRPAYPHYPNWFHDLVAEECRAHTKEYWCLIGHVTDQPPTCDERCHQLLLDRIDKQRRWLHDNGCPGF
jgi:hypothetical protein